MEYEPGAEFGGSSQDAHHQIKSPGNIQAKPPLSWPIELSHFAFYALLTVGSRAYLTYILYSGR